MVDRLQFGKSPPGTTNPEVEVRHNPRASGVFLVIFPRKLRFLGGGEKVLAILAIRGISRVMLVGMLVRGAPGSEHLFSENH